MGQTVLSSKFNIQRLENVRQIENESLYQGQYASNCVASDSVS